MIGIHFDNTVLEVQENDSSYRYRSLMRKPELVIKFQLAQYVEIPVGAWCEFMGKRYYLRNPQDFKKHGKRNVEYSMRMGSDEDVLGFYKFRNLVDGRLKWSMCAKPVDFLRAIVSYLNKRDGGWTLGGCIDAAEQTLEFNHVYVDEALQHVANIFKTEFEISGKRISLGKVEYNKDNPLPLAHGKGNGFVPGVGRSSLTGEMPIKRIYVQGGTDNIDPSKYGSRELLLPKSQTLEYEGRTYRTDEGGLYIERIDKVSDAVKDDSLDCSDICPSRIGEVSTVTVVDAGKNFYDFTDASIPGDLDFNDYVIEGETAYIRFQTGMLSGEKDFEFKYIHEEDGKNGVKIPVRRFEIVPQEIDGQTMPNETFKPEPGDKYAIFGIMLPGSYICDNDTKTGASWDMFREGARVLYENEEQKFTFAGELQSLWAKRNWENVGGKLIVGGYVLFRDEQFAPDGTLIRIVGVKDYLTSPHSPTVELSNSVSGQGISSSLREIRNQEVKLDDAKRNIIQFTKRRFRDSMETITMLEDALLNFSESINPITVQTMAMLVGDESLQFRFVRSSTDLTQVTFNITYDNEAKQLHCPAGFLQHMTLGISSVSSSHAASEYKVWQMQEFTSAVLDQAKKKYYLYAKVSATSKSGTFLLSDKAIDMYGVAGYYHLLVGVLNSEFDGERSYVDLYGFTEILPGRITTDKIVSSDGQTYFDLVSGIINGRIRITSGSSGLDNLEEFAVLDDQITALNKSLQETDAAVDNLGDYVDGAFADGIISEAEAKAIEKYINTVNNTKSGVEATYTKLYANPHLTGTPKTNLANAKTALFTAIDNLISSINTAISDGATTVAEKNDVDAKFSTFNSKLNGFNKAVEAANESIQDSLKSYTDEAFEELAVLDGQITAQVKRIDSINATISSAGWITTADGNKLWAKKGMEDGDTIISYINQAAGSTTIASNKINLVGAVTFDSFSNGLKDTVNGKADTSDLGSMAYNSSVESSMLGSTIVIGGYLNSEYIKVRKIEAIEGTIAGFHISGTGLVNTGFDNDAYVIFRNDAHKCFAGIGGNVLPSISGLRAVARFENEDQNDWWGLGQNIAMLLSAKNGAYNFAFVGNGNGVLNGWIDGFMFSKFTISTANTIYTSYTDLKTNNRWIVHCTASGSGICLPKLADVRRALGIGSGTNFCVEYTILADLGATSFRIYGRNNKSDSSGNKAWSSTEYPVITNWDGERWDDVEMWAGDSIRFLLIYEGGRYYSLDGFTCYYTARIINRQN